MNPVHEVHPAKSVTARTQWPVVIGCGSDVGPARLTHESGGEVAQSGRGAARRQAAERGCLRRPPEPAGTTGGQRAQATREHRVRDRTTTWAALYLRPSPCGRPARAEHLHWSGVRNGYTTNRPGMCWADRPYSRAWCRDSTELQTINLIT